MNTINLSYNVPIQVTENLDNTEEFIIQGVAISATITDNQHNFLSEELQLASESLNNRPLLKDHDNKTDSIIGRVIGSEYDSTTESIRFKARINNTEQGKKIRELIKSGDLNTVSIGANVKEMDEEDGKLIPRGIKFKELSVVAVPADDDAKFTFRGNTFMLALQEAYNKSKEVKYRCEECDMDFSTEEDYKKHMTEKHNTKNSNSLENFNKIKKEEIMEKDETKNIDFESKFKAQEEKLDAHTKVLEETLSNLKSLKESLDCIKEKIDTKEADADEVEQPKPVEVEEPKEIEEPKETEESEEVDEDEDEEDIVDEKDKYRIVQNYKSFTIERKY